MKYIIIGAGAAGITAAQTIREYDKDVEITIISTDEYVHSRCMLHKYLSHERNEKTISFVPDNFFEANNLHWIKTKKVTAINTDDNSITLDDDSTYTYDKLLIASGADSFIPPIGDLQTAKNVFGLRNLIDAVNIDKMVKKDSKVLIVGSGLVGMDAAYGLLERNIDVTVVEMADRILPLQLDENASKEYQKLFENAGCKFKLGKKLVKAQADSKVIKKAVLDSGEEIECDTIIVAAGVRPAISCLLDSKINTERGINVDSHMCTNIKNVYAAGDVTGLAGIWPNAMEQGKVAAHSMCGKEDEYTDTYAMKNTINFFGLVTLSLGNINDTKDADIETKEDKKCYKKALIKDGKLTAILLQGDIDYSGIYQYLIKNKIDISNKNIFKITFAQYYGIKNTGEYEFNL